jgi:hypothetical protein
MVTTSYLFAHMLPFTRMGSILDFDLDGTGTGGLTSS